MTKHGARLAWLLAVAVAVSSTAPAAAQPAPGEADDATRATARELGKQGIEAYWAKDYAVAAAKLDQAFQLFATPVLALWSARARAQLGKWVEAAERYREARRVSPAVGDRQAQEEAQRDAAQELSALQPRIPTLTLQLEGAEPRQVTFSLDGVRIPSALVGAARPTNPGAHRVEATRGAEHFEEAVPLSEAEQKTLPFRFQEATAGAETATPAPQPRAAQTELQPTAAETTSQPAAASSNPLLPFSVVALSLGAVSLATAGATFALANGRCAKGDCRSSADLNAYTSMRTLSSVSFWTGTVLAVGGVATLLVALSRKQDSESTLSWDVGPAGVSVRGAF